MSAPIISVQNLGKRYQLGAALAHDTLRDQLTAAARAVTGWARGGKKAAASPEDFWALKDVSFDVQPGEVLGIIGRNGAGKSTLLKILSQITEPTEGEIRVKGRIASLLEVGTGFHPELSGRENIFLNGAILGMQQAEIRRKFDEIVAFAEVEQFLDTPVKRYSSGMYVRLAFAVAAHLDPEILVVDEVLAVGDAAFQAKCLAKMGDVAHESGRTVLFVSHNLAAVLQLCTRGVFLERGQVREIGPISNVLNAYQRSFERSAAPLAGTGALNSGQARFVKWELANADSERRHSCHTRDVCEFRLTLVSQLQLTDVNISFILWNAQGELVLAGSIRESHGKYLELGKGEYTVSVKVRLPIKAGLYQIDARINSVSQGEVDACCFEPKLNVLPQKTTLAEKWHGLLTEDVSFTLTPAA